MFDTTDFVFNGINSAVYGAYIVNSIGTSGIQKSLIAEHETTTDTSANGTMHTFGVKETKNLEFPLTIYFPDGLNRYDISAASKWLFNNTGYKELQILEDDMSHIYFEAKFNKVSELQHGTNIGFECTVETNSPYAKEYPTTIIRDYTDTPITIPIYNDSDDNKSLFPIIKIYANSTSGGSVIISNSLDPNNMMKVDRLTANEIIEINCRNKVPKSNLVDYIHDRFNGNYIELLPNRDNFVTVNGSIKKIEITYQNLRRMGV